MRTKIKILYLLIFIIVPLNKIYTQTQPKTTEEIEKKNNITLENNPLVQLEPSNYLEKHIASNKIPIIKENTEKNLRKLAKILKHYQQEIQNSQKNYEEAVALYKKAIEFYYSGNLLDSLNLFQKSRNITNELLLNFTKIYKSKCIDISTEIVMKLSTLEEDKINAPYFLIYETEHRLNVMKNKISSSEELIRFNKYGEAIDLLRNAKIIGILALYQLEKEPAKKQEILNKYKVDLEDANYNTQNINLETF